MTSSPLRPTPTQRLPVGVGLCALRPSRPEALARTDAWLTELHTLGALPPLFWVHDLGQLLSLRSTAGAWADADASPAGQSGNWRIYLELVRELDAHPAVRAARELRLGDRAIAACILHILSPLGSFHAANPPAAAPAPTSSWCADGAWPHATAREAESELSIVEALRFWIHAGFDSLDLGTLRLHAWLGDDPAGGSVWQLLHALGDGGAHAAAQFSLELLPTVLEPHRGHGAGRQAADGYASTSRKGSLDALWLSELAWEDDEFLRRMAHDELMYHAHAHEPPPQPLQHLLLLDASASMRGAREAFARGLVLAMAQRLLGRGERVQLQMFDSRLYRPLECARNRLPIAQLLGFRSERGRNPARVLSQLTRELTAAGGRHTQRRAVHLFTHAALQVPREVVQRLREVAQLHGVFIVPDGHELALEWTEWLDSVQIASESQWPRREQQLAQAARIVHGVPTPP